VVVNIFDRDSDGQLNFSEFSKAITPKDRNYLSHPLRRYEKLTEKEDKM